MVDPFADQREAAKKAVAEAESLVSQIGDEIVSLVLDLIGFTDAKKCVMEGDIVACISTALNAVPWGKLFKAAKVAIKAVGVGRRLVEGYSKLKAARRALDDIPAITKVTPDAAAVTKANTAAKAAQDAAASTKTVATKTSKEVASAKKANAKATARAKADDVAETGAQACSFEGSTLVLMADGSQRPIDQVEVGDEVVASDPQTGEQGAREVVHTFVHEDTLVDLVLDDGTVLGTTEDHPFWSVTEQEFERADQLAAGERVLSADGSEVTVAGLRTGAARTAPAYNLEIEGVHTYHVGDDEVLVHNACRTFSSLTPSGVIPDAAGVYVIEMKDGMVYVGSATLRNTIHRRLHRAFTDPTHAVAKAKYTVSDVAQIRTITVPGGAPAQIHKMEQALIDSYGGWRGSRLLNRSNVAAVP